VHPNQIRLWENQLLEAKFAPVAMRYSLTGNTEQRLSHVEILALAIGYRHGLILRIRNFTARRPTVCSGNSGRIYGMCWGDELLPPFRSLLTRLLQAAPSASLGAFFMPVNSVLRYDLPTYARSGYYHATPSC
jgi:hypothetical protein